MEPTRPHEKGRTVGTLNRRAAISGAVATGVAVATHKAVAQGTPEAPPVSGNDIDAARIMALSTRLGGGANLKESKVDHLVDLLNSEQDVLPAFEELEAISDITDDAIAAASPEAQRLSSNMLQYWFLGRYDGQPVENRAGMFFDLACWQTLPYATQPSTCKSFGYWAIDIEL